MFLRLCVAEEDATVRLRELMVECGQSVDGIESLICGAHVVFGVLGWTDAAYMVVDARRKRSAYRIRQMGVRADCRRNRVGTELLSVFLGYHDGDTLSAIVDESDLASQLFFRSCGFKGHYTKNSRSIEFRKRSKGTVEFERCVAREIECCACRVPMVVKSLPASWVELKYRRKKDGLVFASYVCDHCHSMLCDLNEIHNKKPEDTE